MSEGRTPKRSRSDGARRAWWYAVFGVLGGLGLGLLAAAFVLFPGGDGDTDGAAASVPRDAATGSGSAPAAGAAESERAEFPAQYDTLGVAIGSEDAPVVVREFADYQCPYCAQFAPTVERLRAEYVESGRVRFVFFDLPLPDLHPNAMVAAQASRCADRQDAYWAMHDLLFEKQGEWADAETPARLFGEYARAIGIDPAVLVRCVESGATRREVETSRRFAQALGVRSTPTTVIGDKGYSGTRSWAEVRSLIEERLEAAK